MALLYVVAAASMSTLRFVGPAAFDARDCRVDSRTKKKRLLMPKITRPSVPCTLDGHYRCTSPPRVLANFLGEIPGYSNVFSAISGGVPGRRDRERERVDSFEMRGILEYLRVPGGVGKRGILVDLL